MTALEEQMIVGRAARPDYYHYFIYYTTPGSLGWSVVTIKSPNSLELVKGEFLNDFWDEHPRILFVVCPGPN